MDEMNLKSKIQKVRYCTYKGEIEEIVPNVINRDSSSETPNRKWTTDVTQINKGPIKLYLFPF